MKRILIAVLIAPFLLVGCTQSGVSKDKALTNTQLDRYQANQPIPQADWSQYRQTLIDVENAQIHGIATTTFFYNMGVKDPIKSCPSLGYPVASTSQITNPDQKVGGSNGNVTIAQMEPNGSYTGDSQGTYVACVATGGVPYVTYWEGHVETEGGPAHWDKANSQIVLDGIPTVGTKSGK